MVFRVRCNMLTMSDTEGTRYAMRMCCEYAVTGFHDYVVLLIHLTNIHPAYLLHFLESLHHEVVVSERGPQEPWHQAEAHQQRKRVLQGQLLGIDQSPVIWAGKEIFHKEIPMKYY